MGGNISPQCGVIWEPVLLIDAFDDMPRNRLLVESDCRNTVCSSPRASKLNGRNIACDGANDRRAFTIQITFVDLVLPLRCSNVISANAVSILSQFDKRKKIPLPS